MSRRALRSTSGRRSLSAGGQSAGRAAVMGVMLVALTAAFLTIAGTTPHGVGARVQTYKRVQLDQRTFTCGGGIPGTVASHGSVAAGLSAPEPVGEPKQFDF